MHEWTNENEWMFWSQITVTPGATPAAKKKVTRKTTAARKKLSAATAAAYRPTGGPIGGGPGNLRGHVRLGRSDRVASPTRNSRALAQQQGGGRQTWLPAGPNLTHGSSTAVSGDGDGGGSGRGGYGGLTSSQGVELLRERQAKETRLAERSRTQQLQRQQQQQQQRQQQSSQQASGGGAGGP